MLISAEIGVVEHSVGIEDANDRDFIEVETFRNHLRADEEIGAAGREIVDDTFVSLTGAGGVEIHAGNACLGEDRSHLVFNLLRTVAPRLQFMAATGWTLCRHLIGVTTVMARELSEVAMEGKGHVTVLAMGHPTTLLALNHRGIAATVLEEDGLLAPLQCLAYL